MISKLSRKYIEKWTKYLCWGLQKWLARVFFTSFSHFTRKETLKICLCVRKKRPDTFDQVSIRKGAVFQMNSSTHLPLRRMKGRLQSGQVRSSIWRHYCRRPWHTAQSTNLAGPVGRGGQSYKRERRGRRGKASLCWILEQKECEQNFQKLLKNYY